MTRQYFLIAIYQNGHREVKVLAENAQEAARMVAMDKRYITSTPRIPEKLEKLNSIEEVR